MSKSEGEVDSLRQLKDFLVFLRKLWGTLAGISVFFPLSNAFVKVLPLEYWPEGGLAYFPPSLVGIVATLTATFVVIWTFGQRHQLRKARGIGSLQRSTWRSFGFGLIALVIYVIAHFAIKDNFYFGVLGWQSDDRRRLIGDVILLLSYGAFFASMTRAFVGLGMIEYFGRRN